MSIVMRLLLFAGSVLMLCYVLFCVRRSRMRTEDSLFWVFFSLILLFLAVFPSAAETVAGWLGVISTVNLVYLVIIFILLVKLLLTDQKVSRLEAKLTHLMQEYAVNHCDPVQTRAAQPADITQNDPGTSD